MSIRRGLSFLAFLLLGAYPGVALGQVKLSPEAEAVRSKVQQIAVGSPITVVPLKTPQEFGTLLASGDTTFRLHDVDSNFDVDFVYTDVRKVKNGYGGYNSATGQHTARHGWLVAVCISVGLLVFLIAELAISK